MNSTLGADPPRRVPPSNPGKFRGILSESPRGTDHAAVSISAAVYIPSSVPESGCATGLGRFVGNVTG